MYLKARHFFRYVSTKLCRHAVKSWPNFRPWVFSLGSRHFTMAVTGFAVAKENSHRQRVSSVGKRCGIFLNFFRHSTAKARGNPFLTVISPLSLPRPKSRSPWKRYGAMNSAPCITPRFRNRSIPHSEPSKFTQSHRKRERESANAPQMTPPDEDVICL